MTKLLQSIVHRILLGALLLVSIAGWTQAYESGVRKGIVKVKFTAAMTSTLNARANGRTNSVTTGIQNFDAASKKAKATSMYRLFPYDSRFENKLRKHGLHLWYVLEVDAEEDPKIIASQFRQLKEVAVAEVEHEKVIAPYQVKAHSSGVAPFNVLPFNDPLLADQWHYNNTGQSGFSDADINLFEAWNATSGANDIIVSVHDEGVDVNHVDLKANIWVNEAEQSGVSGIDDDGNGYIDDVNGYNFEKNKGAVDAQYHGTHVAGTIAAVNNNGVGVSGVAGGDGSGNGVKIMSMQILGGAAIENSYIYAANNGAVISQNSWGYNSPGSVDQSVLEAIDYFVAEAGDYPNSPMKGGIVIFAAGNSNHDGDWYPGYHANTFAVGALGPEGKKASYSNFGNWVELSAPGGDWEYNTKSGVLSTIPKDQYAYLQGTSMACPHVSGIAALALANRTQQLTAEELWNKLITGVVKIDQYNEGYEGLLGSGAIDAALAIRNDQKASPEAITTLNVTGIAQEFATLEWNVPADEDDSQPVLFTLYYHNVPITSANLVQASKVEILNDSIAGRTFKYELQNLLGLMQYHFAVTSTDRWGNVSEISNVVTATTNQGPSIAVDANSESITLEIDASLSTTATHNITLLNGASGILRWSHFMRHANSSMSFSTSGINYPVTTKTKFPTNANINRRAVGSNASFLRSDNPESMAFTAIEKTYSSWPTNIIGETDLALSNSAAAKFFVTENDGFNLTQVRMYLKHDPALGPVVLEIYKGSEPVKTNLIFAQEHNNWGTDETWAHITLNEQLYFQSGEIFWVAVHVPAGNLFPLGIGFEDKDEYSKNCFISFDTGATWGALEEAISSKDFAWAISADSYNAHLGTYLSLAPGAGDINGNEQAETTLSANGASLINGTYNANLVIASNDAQKQELRIPVSLTVKGQLPKIAHPDIVDFGSVFVGTSKTLDIVLDNQGFGNYNQPEFNLSGNNYVIEGSLPWQIQAREEVVLRIKLTPTAPGNINDILTITNGSQTYQISLFGVGAETSRIVVSPEQQTIADVTIGDVVNAQVVVQNTGAYPLKYFVPGFDEKGISDNWPTDYHSYGYKVRTNFNTEANPLVYAFQNISETGENITASIKDDTYYSLDMGFEFPYYGEKKSTIYIAQKGFTAFDNSVRPINSPNFPGNEYAPRGIISILGTFLSFVGQGEIFYQVEADRVIIQYDNVWDGWNPETITAQMVLFANGDIRFFYDHMGFTTSNQNGFNILIEDMEHQDGILLHDYEKPLALFSGLALGLDYPGPNIISTIENGSGIIAPGNAAMVDLEMNTTTLTQGTVKRYLTFISNDPEHSQTSALIELLITAGGTAQPVVSLDTIRFGDVFQGAVRANKFTIKNSGTADVDITNMEFVKDEFTLSGDAATIIKPGLYENYSIAVPTTTLATLEDWLSINYADGSHDTIYVSGKVIAPPSIDVDLSLLQKTLAFGATSDDALTIENTGVAPLEVSIAGKQWLSFNSSAAATSNSYIVEKHNNDNVYQWVDIRKTGTQLPFLDFDDFDGTFWRDLELPFVFEYYGVEYTSLKIGDNGIISFEEEPAADLFTDYIPSATHEGPCIMPYWTFSGFTDYLYAIEDIGIFYQNYGDKFIITWSYFTNNFGGMGDPVSAQIIFYANGTMKFQYKKEEGGADFTSGFSTIGIQKNATSGISISEYLPLDFGTGLAYILVPSEKYEVAAGESLIGNININAKNIYGGIYTADLQIETNVPGSETLTKPVELTVTGDGVMMIDNAVDFGSHRIEEESGMPKTNYLDLPIGNSGSAAFDITSIHLADGSQSISVQVWALVDGWFGPEWRWADISELYASSPTPVFTIKPGDLLKTRITFSPTIAGDYADEINFTTSVGEVKVSVQGSGFEPPVVAVDTTPILVMMNTTSETANRTIAFNNADGKSLLTYDVSIDFGRAVTSQPSSHRMAASGSSTNLNFNKAVIKDNGARIKITYNRVITHTSKDIPDTFVGTGGSAPFTLATKYNAGPDGFNISHVETWFKTETLSQGSVQVEIRAGGNSIAESTLLAEGSVTFETDGQDESGSWYQVVLDQPAGIYPNEDFYVVVTYPLGIALPQGTITGVETVPGIYYYFSEGLWYNLQDVQGFESMGWLMYAAEETATTHAWLSITSDLAGSLAVGAGSTIDLLIEGTFAARGDQVANIVIRSNDPANAMVTVPVTLHLNDAPNFSGVPQGIAVSENATEILTVGVSDVEGNEFTVTSAENYSGVEYSFEDGILTITLSPQYGDAGEYIYTFVATDEHNASREMTLVTEVLFTNRAPEFIAESKTMNFQANGVMNEFKINNFFVDPDNDDFSFTIASDNPASVNVFASADGFIIRPLAIGNSNVVFITTDSHGAVAKDTIDVTVDVVLSSEQPFLNNGLAIYPNPAHDFANITFTNDWTGDVELQLIDATGKLCLAQKTKISTSGDVQIDVKKLTRGFYILKASSGRKYGMIKLIKN